jgi:MFS family permease
MIETILPLQLRLDGAPPRVYGLLLALNCVGVVALEAPLAIRLGRRPSRPLIAIGVALLGLGYLPMTVAPTVVMAVLAVVLVTVGEIIYKPTATAYAADLAPSSLAGRYQSAYAGASVAGFTVTPLLCGPLFEWQPRSAWAVAGVAALLAATYLAASRRTADAEVARAGPGACGRTGQAA